MKKILTCVLMVTALSGCGIKPSSVKPPADSAVIYPRTYPNPELDKAVAPATATPAPVDESITD